MRKLFDYDFIVTRPFGFKDGYYTKFGFLGHEGCDFVPNSTQQAGANIYSPIDGEVIRDTDDISQDPNWSAYGKKVIVWNAEKKIAFWFCHLQSNSVKLGQKVKEGDLVGKMGHTSTPGNVFGDHLHLNMCNTDENGNRLDQDNGYKGFIDPLPFIMQGPDQPMNVLVPTSTFETLVNKSTKYDDFERAGFTTINDVNKKVTELEQSRDGFIRDRDEWRGKAEHFTKFLEQIAKTLNSPVEEAEVIKIVTGLVSGEVDCQSVRDELNKTKVDLTEASSNLSEEKRRTITLSGENKRLEGALEKVTERVDKAEKTLADYKAGHSVPFRTIKVLGIVIRLYTK